MSSRPDEPEPTSPRPEDETLARPSDHEVSRPLPPVRRSPGTSGGAAGTAPAGDAGRSGDATGSGTAVGGAGTAAGGTGGTGGVGAGSGPSGGEGHAGASGRTVGPGTGGTPEEKPAAAGAGEPTDAAGRGGERPGAAAEDGAAGKVDGADENSAADEAGAGRVAREAGVGPAAAGEPGAGIAERGRGGEPEAGEAGAGTAGREAGAERAAGAAPAAGAGAAERQEGDEPEAGEAGAEEAGEAGAEEDGREAGAEEAGREAGADRGERSEPSAVRRLVRSPAGLLIGLLIGLLGFGLAVQVRSNTSTNGLSGARQEDLVRILDELSSREDRLRRQIAELEAARARLSTTGDRSTAALEEARKRSTALGILAGTLPAQGPGVELTLTDPERRLAAEDLLDAVEELRAAGAEAIQVGTVRIGLDSAFTSADGGIAVDGIRLTAPYTIIAIGDPPTLATAMEIPGGVADTVGRAGGEARIGQREQLVIRALRALKEPQYSRPSDGGN